MEQADELLAALTVEKHRREPELTPQICLQGAVLFLCYRSPANLTQNVCVTWAKPVSACAAFLVTWEVMCFLLNDTEIHSKDTKLSTPKPCCLGEFADHQLFPSRGVNLI